MIADFLFSFGVSAVGAGLFLIAILIFYRVNGD